MRSNFFLGVGVGVAGMFAGKNLLIAKYYVKYNSSKKADILGNNISSLICSIKSPLAADIPEKLNFTSCDSSLRPCKWKLNPEQSFHMVLSVLQHFARNLEFV